MEKALQIENVTKNFHDFKLGPLNVELEAGMVVGLIGPNGSGKTTTMQCVNGLLKSESGCIQIYGMQQQANRTDWKQEIGYVGDIQVFYENWNGKQNLKFVSQFFKNWSQTFADELCKRFELPLDKRVKSLSTGNRIKLSLVMALAHKPRLLLLDEPTSGLDPVVRSEVLDVLFSILEDGQHTIFYSTHILSDISRLADELIFINNGLICGRSATTDLLENWRQLTFSADTLPNLPGLISKEQNGSDFRIVVSDCQKALHILKKSNVQDVQQSRLTIEEIAVHILKENKHVVNH